MFKLVKTDFEIIGIDHAKKGADLQTAYMVCRCGIAGKKYIATKRYIKQDIMKGGVYESDDLEKDFTLCEEWKV
jgi:hypothetical protein